MIKDVMKMISVNLQELRVSTSQCDINNSIENISELFYSLNCELVNKENDVFEGWMVDDVCYIIDGFEIKHATIESLITKKQEKIVVVKITGTEYEEERNIKKIFSSKEKAAKELSETVREECISRIEKVKEGIKCESVRIKVLFETLIEAIRYLLYISGV